VNAEQADKLLTVLLERLVSEGGSDLFITAGFAPAIKKDGRLVALMERALGAEQAERLVAASMSQAQRALFAETQEAQFAIAGAAGRFRVSAFVQRGHAGAVIRVINTEIPTLADLDLPETLAELVMAQRGLVLFVGATGSGKSTSLAAMLGHRNRHAAGHIITLEDPIEFVHEHAASIVTQREIGVDTQSWTAALQNTLRQAPDVILVGEVRSRETMEHALNFAETGHLVLASLHANNASQAIDRVLNLFDEAERAQRLMDLSLNLQGVVSQRLVRRATGGRVAALEMLLATPLVSDLILRGRLVELREAMARGTEQGMQTFDQHLFRLYEAGTIDLTEALRHADSANELRLNIKLASQRAAGEQAEAVDGPSLGLADTPGADDADAGYPDEPYR